MVIIVTMEDKRYCYDYFRYGNIQIKGQETVVVFQNKSFVYRKSMDDFPRKFEPGKWTLRNRDSHSNDDQIVFATGQILF